MIRPEQISDIEGIRELTKAAFAASEFGHNGEADLIENIRDAGGNLLSLVAEAEGKVVGHILFSPLTIETDAATIEGVGLGPMSVAPEFQKRGIGGALIQYGLNYFAEVRVPFVVVFGHAAYYQRFGFLPAAERGCSHGFFGMPQDLLFVHLLESSVESKITNGRVTYHEAFGPQWTE
ncbi:MAG: GNAT family N-acetyltransferase [Verrucomicrobiales bacterium]|nr:GNAT family N-acetyltransferase [Verrucomicrobiales bacterium]